MRNTAITRTVLWGLASGLASIGAARAATTATITVDVDKPGITIPKNFYGLMTEEINHAYDGGLYAELIRNRELKDDATSPVHWSAVSSDGAKATIALDSSQPVNAAMSESLRVELTGSGRGGAANSGYWGIPVWPNTPYSVSFYARAGDGFSGKLAASIESIADNTVGATAQTDAPPTAQWKRYTLTLHTPPDAKPSADNRFVLSTDRPGTFWLADVSLFPPTYQDHPNGLRPDLMEKMAAMHPAFLRMPGGNYLEGDTFPTRFNWKHMIGPVDDRAGHMGCWGYRSSDGFGLPEYLTWCQQLHMEPVLAVFAGYTLNHDYVRAGPRLQPYVDDALDEIEYCTGDTSTPWGKRRADDGHPGPFTIHYVEIGNEDEFDHSGSYDGRFAQFFDAIRARYPKLQIIATAPVKSRRPDVIDDHFYRSARQMERDWTHYDKHDRNGPKVFCGEWATQEGRPTPDLNAALADAAWLMGLERNSDLVVMESYAPLLVNVNRGAWEWPTNLIGYDALSSFGSPSYWMQAMFGQNRGDCILRTELQVPPTIAATEPVPHGAIGVGTWRTNAQFKDIRVTSPDGKTLLAADLSKDTSGWKIAGGKWTTADSVMRQSTEAENCYATIGDPRWTDYTLRLKARKISGREGFLVLFHVLDSNNYIWWNVGGWGNTQCGFEGTYDGGRDPIGSKVEGSVEPNRWYDLKVEVAGHHFRAYLDGKLINDAIEPPTAVPTPIFASASYIHSSSEVVLKIVNAQADAVDAAINLRGVSAVANNGTAIVLAGDSPNAVNTIEQPTRLAPQQQPLDDAGPQFHRRLPPFSITLLRIKASAP